MFWKLGRNIKKGALFPIYLWPFKTPLDQAALARYTLVLPGRIIILFALLGLWLAHIILGHTGLDPASRFFIFRRFIIGIIFMAPGGILTLGIFKKIFGEYNAKLYKSWRWLVWASAILGTASGTIVSGLNLWLLLPLAIGIATLLHLIVRIYVWNEWRRDQDLAEVPCLTLWWVTAATAVLAAFLLRQL